MSDAQSYPPSLSYAISKLSGFARQTVKIVPSRTDSISGGDTIRVDLPANALCDLSTLQLAFDLTTTATGGTTPAAGPPKHSENLISKIAVSVNGVVLMSSGNLQLINTMLLNLSGGTDMTGRRKPYQLGADSAATDVTAQPIVISNFLGFVSSVSPRVLDTALTGAVSIEITFSNTGMLTVANADNTGVSLTIDSCRAMMDVLSINDGAYYESVAAFLKGGGVIECPFQNWVSTLQAVSSTTQTTRFNLNTGSLDLVMAAFPKNFGNTPRVLNSTMGQTAALQLTSGDHVDSWNFSVNNSVYPAFQPKAEDALPLANAALGVNADVLGGCDPKITTATIYEQNSWIAAYKFAADGVDVSGLSTLGSAAPVSFQTTATSGSSEDPGFCFLAAATTSILRISAGQSIQVIY